MDLTKYQLNAADSVVFLIDMQEKLLATIPDREPLTKNVEILLKAARLLDLPIIWSEQYPRGLGATVEPLADLLKVDNGAEKLDFSAMRETSLVDKLNETSRKTVLLPGIETHVCVMQTALDLLQDGFSVFVPSDCVSSRTADNKRIGLSIMQEAGAVITSMETAVFQMFGRAGGDAFKNFSKLIR